MEEQSYTLTKLSLKEFTQELDELWDEMKDPNSELSRKAAREGIDLEPLRALRREEAIVVERKESGFDMTDVIMAFVAHGVVEIVKVAWAHLLYPRIKSDLGEDSIKPDNKD